MGDTFHSGGKQQVIVKGNGAIGQINKKYTAPHRSAAEILTLLGQALIWYSNMAEM